VRLSCDFTVYVADFGISRPYTQIDAGETDGRTSFTRKYAAPEIIDQETRGLAADIFSLGCVFLEIYTVLWDADVEPYAGNVPQSTIFAHHRLRRLHTSKETMNLSWYRLKHALNANNCDNSYQANLDALVRNKRFIWHELPSSALRLVIERMMSDVVGVRPTAAELKAFTLENPCCGGGSCELEAMVETDDLEEEILDDSKGESSER